MNQPIRVFYYEDDPQTAYEVQTFLERPPSNPGDPELKVTHHLTAKRAFGAIEQWSGRAPDVALLNVHQDNYAGAGLDLCREIKKTWPRVPVVFLSNLASIADQAAGYEAGASQYLSKELLYEPGDRNSYGLSSLPRNGMPRIPASAKSRIGTAGSRSTRWSTRFTGARRRSH